MLSTLIKEYFIAKCTNKHLSLQCIIIFLLVEGLPSVLMAADWWQFWLLKVWVAMVIYKNKRAMKLSASINSSSHELFCSNAVWWHLTKIELRSKLESICCCFINKVYVIFEILCCYFNNLGSIFTRSRFHLKKLLSLLIHKK